MATINHIGIYVSNLELVGQFFVDYFRAKIANQYHNPNTGLSTYFLTFADGARLELLNRPNLVIDNSMSSPNHLSISVGSKRNVDDTTIMLRRKGYEVMDGPRRTGDGYYESSILGPESLIIEVTK
jgi:lactoylglutathione lyase